MQRNQLLNQAHVSAHCKNNKSIVFPINDLERPTIDAVLNSVPLFYDPITKQLVLQRDFEHSTRNSSVSDSSEQRPASIELRCSPKFIPTDHRPSSAPSVKFSPLKCIDSGKCNRKLLETTLDDFTTLSKSPPKSENGNKLLLSAAWSACKAPSADRPTLLAQTSGKRECVSTNTLAVPTAVQADTSNTSMIINKTKDSLTSPAPCVAEDAVQDYKKDAPSVNKLLPFANSVPDDSDKKPPPKDSYKRHRRTPSYIHDFHNLLKNTPITTTKVSTTTASSAAAASAKLTACSLAHATSELVNQTGAQETNRSNGRDDMPTLAKQASINETPNQFFLLSDSIPPLERDVPALQLPPPYPPEKTGKFSVLGHSLQHMLSRLRLRKSRSQGNSAPTSNNSSRCASFANSPAAVHRPISAMEDSECDKNQSASAFTCSNVVKQIAPNSINVHDVPPSSTTALLLEQRPAHLPLKSPEEQAKHRALYEAMVREAKRKEVKDARATKKEALRKAKEEERLAEVIRTWQDEILPNFESARHTRKVRDLWFNGIPPNLRARVWQAAIGNELNISEELFQICLNRFNDLDQRLVECTEKGENDALLTKLRCMKEQERSNVRVGSQDALLDEQTQQERCTPLHLGYELQESEESILEQMRLDVSRTLPSVGLFQDRAPLHLPLLQVLGAYVFSYRPDVGYVQGMSFLAGQLLLHMDAPCAFTCFANLLNRNHVLLAFVRLDQLRMRAYYAAFDVYLQLNAPTLHAHLKMQSLTCDLYLLDWILTLFTRALPLDLCARLWDLLFRDGEQLIFCAAIALLQTLQAQLLASDLSSNAQFLSRLQQHAQYIDQTHFFNNLTNVKMGQVILGAQGTKCKDFQAVFQLFWQREITQH